MSHYKKGRGREREKDFFSCHIIVFNQKPLNSGIQTGVKLLNKASKRELKYFAALKVQIETGKNSSDRNEVTNTMVLKLKHSFTIQKFTIFNVCCFFSFLAMKVCHYQIYCLLITIQNMSPALASVSVKLIGFSFFLLASCTITILRSLPLKLNLKEKRDSSPIPKNVLKSLIRLPNN